MMKVRHILPAIAASLVFVFGAHAQAPAGAPAGSTGLCNDGTYWTGATKAGACRGHKGIKTWFAADASKPAAAAKPAPAATPAPAAAAKPAPVPKPASTPAPAMSAKPAPAAAPAPAPAASSKKMPEPNATAAPGGGPGMVWVNTKTLVYHCPGDRYYGKTKDGQYMSEKDAMAKGAKGSRGSTCSK